MKNSDFSLRQNHPSDVELDTLLHPALAFEHPREVVRDPDLTLNEKRAILAPGHRMHVRSPPHCGAPREAPIRSRSMRSSRRYVRSTSSQTQPTRHGTGIRFGGDRSRHFDPTA